MSIILEVVWFCKCCWFSYFHLKETVKWKSAVKGQVKRESQTRNGSFYTKWLLCRHDIMDQRNILRELLCVSWKWQTYWRIIKLVYFFSIKLMQFKKGRVFMTSEIVVSINALKTQNSHECFQSFFENKDFCDVCHW